MAKKSSIEKNARRVKLVKQNSGRRARLKAIAVDRTAPPEERFEAQLKLADLPRVYNGLGISILSTPRGVMSDNEARVAKVGGEVLCRVF